MVKISHLLQVLTYLVVVVSYASVVRYVELYHSLSFGLLLALSVYLNFNRFVRIPRWVLNGISIAILLVSSLAVSTEYLVEPVLGALIVLVAIKLLEEKTFRDYAQIFAMCIFLLIGSSLLSLSIAFLGYFSLIALFSTTALILLAYFAQDAQIAIGRATMSRVLLQSLLICAIALPGSLIFFVILPRTNYPIFSFLNKSGYARAGFTDSIQLGEIAGIQEDNNVIFRAEMPQIDDRDLYWRGIVLDKFDGVSWTSSGRHSPASAMLSPQGRQIAQVIYLEPYGNKFLFALDLPRSISYRRDPLSSDSFTYSLPEYIHERIRYEATSVIAGLVPDETVDRGRYLQVPPDFSPKTKQIVEDLAGGRTGAEAVQALLRFIKQGGYRYSLTDLPASGNPLEDFLFEHKMGNCEYFASALAVMLRMAGVPARLVGGYRGGYYNTGARYYLVLQNNAHVWVEAYLPASRGWLRVDPTAYSQPDPSAAAETGFFMQIKLTFDAFNYYWYKFIINYDFSKQLALVKKIRATIQKPDIKIGLVKSQIRACLPYLLLFLPVAFLVYATLLGTGKEPGQKLVSEFHGKLRRHGYTRHSAEGLEEFVARIEPLELRLKAALFVNRFESIYYRDGQFSEEDIRSLRRHIKDL